MKKVLFINYSNGIEHTQYPDVNNFFKGKKSMALLYKDLFKEKEVQVDFVRLEEILILNSDFLINKKSIKDYDFVYLGLISKATRFTFLLKMFLEKNETPHFSYGRYDFLDTKVYEYYTLALHNYPVLPFISFPKLNDFIVDQIEETIGFPFIFKLIDLNQCFGVAKIADREMLKKHWARIVESNGTKYVKQKGEKVPKLFSQDLFIAQKFVPDYEEFRAIVFENKVLYSVTNWKKFAEVKGKQIKCDLPQEQIDLIEAASKIISTPNSMLGVDLLRDNSTGVYYILEMNSGPQYIDSSIIAEFNFPQFLVDYIILRLK